MGRPSKAVMDFMEKFSVDSDEIWEVHGSTWVVKHKALERVAAEQGIVFDLPQLKVCDLEKGLVVVLVTGKMGERSISSFGEASPKNCKNAYPVAMAEKRAADRVILKLLSTHGALYSEAEADEFVQPRQNPHVNRAEEFHDEFSPDIQPPASPVAKMKVKNARGINGAPGEYEILMREMRRHQDAQELYEWVTNEEIKKKIYALPGDWPQHFRGEYANHKASITPISQAAE